MVLDLSVMPRKSVAKSRCALCGAKDVSEPRGEERYCRDCWDKKIAVEEIVAREFALKRYIRAHSAEKYLVYHSTHEAAVRTAHRRRRRLRPVPDADALSRTSAGTRRPTTSKATPRAARSPSSSSTSSPPRSSSRGAAASGTSRSSAPSTPSPRTGTARCNRSGARRIIRESELFSSSSIPREDSMNCARFAAAAMVSVSLLGGTAVQPRPRKPPTCIPSWVARSSRRRSEARPTSKSSSRSPNASRTWSSPRSR